MNLSTSETSPYQRVLTTSRRVAWDIDADVIRGRIFDRRHAFLPDGLSLADRVPFLDDPSLVFFSQVQGRTYANMFGLIERFVNAKVLEVGRRHSLGDQAALEAMVRFSEEELKHQELFRRIEDLAAREMPPGYRFAHDANAVAGVVLARSTWSVLALLCLVELVTQAHYKESIQPEGRLSPLFKDVFRFHWLEESQHALLDELEWDAEDARIDAEARDRAVTDLIELVGAVDGLVGAQARDDAAYFLAHAAPNLTASQRSQVELTFASAYRWQYVLSGVKMTRFPSLLQAKISEVQFQRVAATLAALA